ncbi:hypothetical protein FBQ97_20160, partial [Acidobacteria bacterium ACD]|nr:hypothetical protein [Acidobacteria bacterium ACD]
ALQRTEREVPAADVDRILASLGFAIDARGDDHRRVTVPTWRADVTREVFGLLKESGLNFVGNCEGRDVYGGEVDVIVTDGFTGNVILKVSESLAHLVEEALKQEITRSLQASMGFLLSKDAFRAFKKRLDYSEYGGAPLLGVKGACLIGHGRSNTKAVRNAVRAADEFARRRIPEMIRAKALQLAPAALGI